FHGMVCFAPMIRQAETGSFKRCEKVVRGQRSVFGSRGRPIFCRDCRICIIHQQSKGAALQIEPAFSGGSALCDKTQAGLKERGGSFRIPSEARTVNSLFRNVLLAA